MKSEGLAFRVLGSILLGGVLGRCNVNVSSPMYSYQYVATRHQDIKAYPTHRH